MLRSITDSSASAPLLLGDETAAVYALLHRSHGIAVDCQAPGGAVRWRPMQALLLGAARLARVVSAATMLRLFVVVLQLCSVSALGARCRLPLARC